VLGGKKAAILRLSNVHRIMLQLAICNGSQGRRPRPCHAGPEEGLHQLARHCSRSWGRGASIGSTGSSKKCTACSRSSRGERGYDWVWWLRRTEQNSSSRGKGDSGAISRISRLAAAGGKETVLKFDAYYGPFWSFLEPSKQCGLT